MPSFVLGDGGDQDESGLCPALKEPAVSWEDRWAGLWRGVGVQETFFGFDGSGKGF